mgnify:FL=1|jgi:hypothetical protein
MVSPSFLTRFSLSIHPMKFFTLTGFPALAACMVLAACGQPLPEEEKSGADRPPGKEEMVEVVERGSDGQDSPSAVLLESSIEPISPDSVPGSYQDPDVPEVTYTFNRDGSWEATWQPQDESRGLLMSGVYMVEEGGLLHLRALSFGRRDSLLGDDWDRRAPPHPRPRAYFRVEGGQLVIIAENTAQAFTMAPFTAVRLVRVADKE